jgi:2-keto-4-pentenoate hydratase/2-oxohepta-3-ene-1,7-dioic acid hydratase in catechol pathway
MRIARIDSSDGPRFAEFDAAAGWRLLDGTIETGFTRTDRFAAADSALLAPCEPVVVIGMAHNSLPTDQPPQAFLKSARTVVGPLDPIVLDPRVGATQVETELAIVIGRHCRNLTAENALDAVFGYTIGNDVTTVAQIPHDELLTQVKQGDGYTPLGPWIETGLTGVDDLEMRAFVDGDIVSTGRTSGLAALVRDQLVYVTRYLSLGPGDVILGGCPGSFGAVHPGQRVRLEIDGLGALENPVVALELRVSPVDTPDRSFHATQR